MTARRFWAGWRPGVLTWTAFWSLLLCAGLELWRPCYFLTDDNISLYYPLLVAAMQRLWGGESPFWEPNLFGGLDLLRYPLALCLWTPLTLVLSPLALTPYKHWLIDLLAILHILAAAVGFALLGQALRPQLGLALSNRRLIFLSVSYAFSGFAIVIGAAWWTFLVPIAVLPYLVLGLWHPRPRSGRWLAAGSLLYGAVAGHLHPFIWTLLFIGALALASCRIQRSREPIMRLGAGLGIALLAAAPLLLPALQGFAGMSRNQGVDLTQQNISPHLVGLSLVSGNLLPWLTGITIPDKVLSLTADYCLLLASCLGGGLLWATLSRRPAYTAQEKLCLGCLLAAVILAFRPWPLPALLEQLPLLRSLRWPFRELLFFQFFLHLYLLLRPLSVPRPAGYGLALAGAAIWAVSLLRLPPPTLIPMETDRRLIMSGELDRYRQELARHNFPGARWVPVVPREAYAYFQVLPWSLTGAFNYPALLKIPSLSGYTVTGFNQALPVRNIPYPGTLQVEQAAPILQAPHIIALELQALDPLRIALHKNGTRTWVRTPDLARLYGE